VGSNQHLNNAHTAIDCNLNCTTAIRFLPQIALLPGETSFRFAQKSVVLLLQFLFSWRPLRFKLLLWHSVAVVAVIVAVVPSL
jgi:hypothetical protein